MFASASSSIRRGPGMTRWWRLVFLAATVYLVARGIGPGLRQGQDFAPVYCASRLWIQGLDPYDDTALKAEAARAGITTPIGLPNFAAVYPPLTLVATAPIALLRFPIARLALLVLNLLALGGCWWLLTRRLAWPLQGTRSLALAAVILGLAGVHTCLKDGQLTPIVLLGILLALGSGSSKSCASLAWTAALMKYSISVPYMGLSLRRGRENLVALFVAGGVFVGAVAVVAVPVGLGTLLHDYVASVASLFAAGVRDDPMRIGEGTASMVWLKALLYRVFSFAPAAVPAINAVAVAAMAGVLVLSILRCRDEGRLLLLLGAFVLLTSYHRVYDSVLLLPGIAWLIDRWVRQPDRERVLLAALLLPFLVPGPGALQTALSDQLKSHWLVYAVAIPHQTWCLLAIFAVASRVAVAEMPALRVHRVGAVTAGAV